MEAIQHNQKVRGSKPNQIKRTIQNKIKEWTNTIGDIDLKEEIKENCIITGGCIASMLLGEPVNDYDVFFRDLNITKWIAEYYSGLINTKIARNEEKIQVFVNNNRIQLKIVDPVHTSTNQSAINVFSPIAQNENKVRLVSLLTPNINKKYMPIFASNNAITLSNDLQLIIRFYGEPDDIHETFDFVHCMNYYDSGEDELVLKPEALQCLLSKMLVYTGSMYPISSIIRTRKFISRGFTCSGGEYLKMAYQASKLDMDDIDVLKEQLVGVDAVQFDAIITELENKKKNPNYSVNYDDLAELVEKNF